MKSPFPVSGAPAPELPLPDPAARAHGERVVAHLRDAIAAAGGAIPFARFMELALYAPGLGYYSAGAHKLGAGGDFITAPEIAPLFSRTLARAIVPLLEALPDARLLEVGAGSGRMAADVLAELAARARHPGYAILERSAELRARQQATLAAAGLADRAEWLDELPAHFTGIVLANELLDALPVHRVVWQEGELHEAWVGWEADGFVWRLGPLTDPRLAGRFAAIRERVPDLPDTYVTEINLAAEDWIATLGERLERGAILLIDYGYGRAEFYHPQRREGTLTCHYRHHRHADPFFRPGLQDITAHVDFTAMADAALAAGLRVAGYTTQAHFLLGSGLPELAGFSDDPRQQLETANQIRRLTLPQEMGETFKVMLLTQDLDMALPGFALRDLRDRL